ncbi:MAG: hypothetical protein KAI47_22565 [Deltaproteobacteria bacterium]|nr:hypothetical protein [Deltaproteobacteria bacterium]
MTETQDAPRYGKPLVKSETYLAPLRERFGFSDEVFADIVLLRHNPDYLAAVHRDHRAPQIPADAQETVGLVFLRTAMAIPKLSTQASMLFGPAATKNIVDLTRPRAEAYLRRETLTPSPTELARCTSPGQVLIGHDGLVLGLAYYRLRDGIPSLESLFPRAWRLPAA